MALSPRSAFFVNSCSRARIRAVPMLSFNRIAKAILIACKIPGVPPSSRCSTSSTYRYSPHGLVHDTVPPPG